MEEYILMAPLGHYRARGVLQLTDVDGAGFLKIVGRSWQSILVIGKTARLIGRLVLVMMADSEGEIADPVELLRVGQKARRSKTGQNWTK